MGIRIYSLLGWRALQGTTFPHDCSRLQLDIHIYFFCRPGGNRAKIAARAAISKTSQNITQTQHPHLSIDSKVHFMMDYTYHIS
jgi:hypothetical protein